MPGFGQCVSLLLRWFRVYGPPWWTSPPFCRERFSTFEENFSLFSFFFFPKRNFLGDETRSRWKSADTFLSVNEEQEGLNRLQLPPHAYHGRTLVCSLFRVFLWDFRWARQKFHQLLSIYFNVICTREVAYFYVFYLLQDAMDNEWIGAKFELSLDQQIDHYYKFCLILIFLILLFFQLISTCLYFLFIFLSKVFKFLI